MRLRFAHTSPLRYIYHGLQSLSTFYTVQSCSQQSSFHLMSCHSTTLLPSVAPHSSATSLPSVAPHSSLPSVSPHAPQSSEHPARSAMQSTRSSRRFPQRSVAVSSLSSLSSITLLSFVVPLTTRPRARAPHHSVASLVMRSTPSSTLALTSFIMLFTLTTLGPGRRRPWCR